MKLVNIEEIDKNFSAADWRIAGMKMYDPRETPFRIHGVFYDGRGYTRLPDEVAMKVSQGVFDLHRNTAGGRVRFRTDSPYITVFAKMGSYCDMPHMPRTGSTGFDVYADGIFAGVYRPKKDPNGYGAVVYKKPVMQDIELNFPTYSDVDTLYVGLSETASVETPKPYSIEKPFVYYGSSITQGGCSSRPGNQYQAYIERAYDADYLNFGFSGNARGEQAMADYLAGLSMSFFILDYDHNARTVEELQSTHANFYRTIRTAHPDIPILMLSRPTRDCGEKESEDRLRVVRDTYETAKKNGDDNVYFLSGLELFDAVICPDSCTVDGTHPNDLGFYAMAMSIMKLIDREKLFPRIH